ncbi:MAG: DUF1294 domain-containing protein [Verrucomicrobiota bacterium]
MTDSLQTAKIVEWDDRKGFGFLQVGKNRVFLHRRDFSERHKRPVMGDVVQFTMGKDVKGRPCATSAAHVNDGGRITVLALVLLPGLLVLPAIALYRAGVNLLWVGGYVIALSAISYWFYAVDKKRAQANEWRVSEAGLHLTELLGGWPGAFLAQRRLRHKVSKFSYQFVFWAIVLSYQFVAFDSLQSWKLSQAALDRVSQHRTGAKAQPRTPMIEIITNKAPASNRP